MSLTNRQKTLLFLLSVLYAIAAIITIEFVTQTYVERQIAAEKATVYDRLSLVAGNQGIMLRTTTTIRPNGSGR